MKLEALRPFFLADCLMEGTTIPKTLSIVTGQIIEDLGNSKFIFDGQKYFSPYVGITLKHNLTKEVKEAEKAVAPKAEEKPVTTPVVETPTAPTAPVEDKPVVWGSASNSQKLNMAKTLTAAQCQDYQKTEKSKAVIRALESRLAELAG